MRPQIRTFAAVAALALLAAGCSRGSSPNPSSTGTTSPATTAAGGDFGTLKNVCHGGNATGATDQGVTSTQIKLGVLTDAGFTHDPQLINAANVFADWCNAAGGIDGRKLVPDIHDTNLLNVVQAMTAACSSDFALVGDSEAFDGLGVKTRLQCLLPDFPAQTVNPQNVGADLQAYPLQWGHSYDPFAGYYQWLLKEKYPDSASSVGIFWGNEPITQIQAAIAAESLKAFGGKVTYNQSFPVLGLSNWTPYAEAIKAKGVKGLVFYGTPQWLASLEQALTQINYKLDWIDTNPDAYGTQFVQLAGSRVLSFETNYAGLDGEYPVELASQNSATKAMVKIFGTYATSLPLTLQVMQAFSSWLLFAVSAESCGSNLTRSCLYTAATQQTAWTGGGLTSPVNLSQPDTPPSCFNVEQATPNGWQPASFGANSGPYRCGAPVYKLQGTYPPPTTLKDVGKSLSDLK